MSDLFFFIRKTADKIVASLHSRNAGTYGMNIKSNKKAIVSDCSLYICFFIHMMLCTFHAVVFLDFYRIRLWLGLHGSRHISVAHSQLLVISCWRRKTEEGGWGKRGREWMCALTLLVASCLCKCVCVREREKEREKYKEREIQTETESVCVSFCERERVCV